MANQDITPIPTVHHNIVVYKFGGACLEDEQKVKEVSDFIAHLHEQRSQKIAVVVSAMGDQTNELIGLAHRFSENPDRRELDVLLTCGERISMALLSIRLNDKKIPARSFTGSQAAIITSNEPGQAKITGVRADRILKEIERGSIPVVAGFQGVSSDKEITTLGRGGSDLTAIALGIALKAKCVVFVKDVPGMYRYFSRPELGVVNRIDYEGAIALSYFGSGLIQARALLLASKYGMKLVIRSMGNQMTEIENFVSEESIILAIQDRQNFDVSTEKGPEFWSIENGITYYLTKGSKWFVTLAGKNFTASFVSDLLEKIRKDFQIPVFVCRFSDSKVDLILERNFLPDEQELLLRKQI